MDTLVECHGRVEDLVDGGPGPPLLLGALGEGWRLAIGHGRVFPPEAGQNRQTLLAALSGAEAEALPVHHLGGHRPGDIHTSDLVTRDT